MSGRCGPWPSSHRIRLAAFNLAGLGLIVVGWYRTSETGSVAGQLRWLNVALAGVVVATVGDSLWVLRGRRGVTFARLEAVPSLRPPALEAERLAETNGHDRALLVSGPRMTHYHRSDCLLMAGKEVHVADRRGHERAGLEPCEVCEP